VSVDRSTFSDSSASSVAVGFNRRTIALLLAAIVGLATFILLMSGGGRGDIAYAQDTMTIEVKESSLTDHDCEPPNDEEWHFLINQIDEEANAPDSITVTWANGESAVVSRSSFTGGVAHYRTTLNLDSAVESATAQIYDEWSGQFVLSHGPCGGPTGTPSGTPSETPSETPSGSPKPSASVSTAAPVPTEVPAGADGASGGGSAAGLLGLAVVAGGAVAGTAVFARRRFLHDA
jgi:hypothetical protein